MRALEKLVTDEFGGFSWRARGQNGSGRPGRPCPSSSTTSARMDTARALLAAMESEEVRLDLIREHAATRRWTLTAALFIAGTLVFVVVIGGA